MAVPDPPDDEPIATAGVVVFEFSDPGGSAQERIEIAPDGHAVRIVSRAGGDRPGLGWWSGSLDDGVLALAVATAERSWADAPQAGSKPAAGAWTATAAGQSIGLWGDGEVRTALSSVLGACASAASRPRAAIELHTAPPAVASDDAVMVHVTAIGDESVVLVAEIDGADSGAAFLTADASTVGFLGGEIRLEPGVEVFGAVYGLASASACELAGVLRADGRADLRVSASLIVAT